MLRGRRLRTMQCLPMVRGDETIGTLNVVRRNSVPFPTSRANFCSTFANQAVIAIENTRLFNELRHRDLRISGAADRDLGGAEGHLEFAGRIEARV